MLDVALDVRKCRSLLTGNTAQAAEHASLSSEAAVSAEQLQQFATTVITMSSFERIPPVATNNSN